MYIDGNKIHAPAKDGVEIHRDLIQSANTKRTSSGKMKGTNIAVKFSATFSFPSASQYAFIGGKMMNQSLSFKAVEI